MRQHEDLIARIDHVVDVILQYSQIYENRDMLPATDDGPDDRAIVSEQLRGLASAAVASGLDAKPLYRFMALWAELQRRYPKYRDGLFHFGDVIDREVLFDMGVALETLKEKQKCAAAAVAPTPDSGVRQAGDTRPAATPVAGAAGKAATVADVPDATGLVANPSDKNAYREANKIINEHPDLARDIKALKRILADHPEIRRWKPRQNRLSIHAGDWLKYVDAQQQDLLPMSEGARLSYDKVVTAAPTIVGMKARPANHEWRCRGCQARYADQPATCKCGRGDFEPVMARPSPAQSKRRK